MSEAGDQRTRGEENVRVEGASLRPGHRWQPIEGPETRDLLSHRPLPPDSRASVRNEALEVLGRCLPPAAGLGSDTGLVVGYVQSGKTFSFTVVSALARDNRFPLVIVIAGVTRFLSEQSRKRLRRDLRLDERDDRKWLHIHNPHLGHHEAQIRNVLREWQDPSVPEHSRRTVLLTVMKHHSRLRRLIDVMRQLDTQNAPALVIDDEADQAGLNNLVNQGEESTTYQRLRELREAIPRHTFLQYTATPQAPLLINLIDVLSPSFAATLSPGRDYIGGGSVFLPNSPYVRIIPDREVPTRARPLSDPPESLIRALQLFFVGVVAGMLTDDARGNRSMLVHPSQQTIGHRTFFEWVCAIREDWIRALEKEDRTRDELLAEFRSAYDDLATTAPELPAFDDLVGRLRHAVGSTEVHLINSERDATERVEWTNAYPHILVGGAVLDRGVTVEGLTVTYMPRGIGVGNADTIQQRARFLGYKRSYLGYCRVFLERAVAQAFLRYVEHEEFVRERLTQHAQEGRPLRELRRTFLLDRRLRPTRDSVIDVDYVRAIVAEGWFYPRAPHLPAEAVQDNRRAVRDCVSELQFIPTPGDDRRTAFQRHEQAIGLSLEDVYDRFLTTLRFASLSDAQNLLGTLIIIRRFLDRNPDARCSIIRMSPGAPRIRTLNANGEIPNLFQGAAPVDPPEIRGEIYPGDMRIRGADTEFTIQIHVLDLRLTKTGEPVHREVPAIAIYIPRGAAGDVVLQDQGSPSSGEDA